MHKRGFQRVYRLQSKLPHCSTRGAFLNANEADQTTFMKLIVSAVNHMKGLDYIFICMFYRLNKEVIRRREFWGAVYPLSSRRLPSACCLFSLTVEYDLLHNISLISVNDVPVTVTLERHVRSVLLLADELHLRIFLQDDFFCLHAFHAHQLVPLFGLACGEGARINEDAAPSTVLTGASVCRSTYTTTKKQQ